MKQQVSSKKQYAEFTDDDRQIAEKTWKTKEEVHKIILKLLRLVC